MVDPSSGGTQPERVARLLLYTGAGLIFLGLIVVYLGYNGAATTTSIVEQFPFLISGGLVGLGLLIVGSAISIGSLIVSAQAGVRQEIADLRDELAALGEAVALTTHGPAAQASTNGVVMVSRGGSSFHKGECRLVEDKTGIRPLPKPEAERQGLLACRICKP